MATTCINRPILLLPLIASLVHFATTAPTVLLIPRDSSTSASQLCTLGFNDFSCSTGVQTPALTMDASLPTWWPETPLTEVGQTSQCYNLLAPSCDTGTEPDCLGSDVPVASPFTTIWMISNACQSDFGYLALFPVQNCSGAGNTVGEGDHVSVALQGCEPGACGNPGFEVYSFQMWENSP